MEILKSFDIKKFRRGLRRLTWADFLSDAFNPFFSENDSYFFLSSRLLHLSRIGNTTEVIVHTNGKKMFHFERNLSSMVYCLSILFGIQSPLMVLSNANLIPEVQFATVAFGLLEFPYTFEIRRHIDLIGCINECTAMESCVFINFKTRTNLCTMTHCTAFVVLFVRQQKKSGNVCWLKNQATRALHLVNINRNCGFSTVLCSNVCPLGSCFNCVLTAKTPVTLD